MYIELNIFGYAMHGYQPRYAVQRSNKKEVTPSKSWCHLVSNLVTWLSGSIFGQQT